MKKCMNCGSTEFIKKNSKYICLFCKKEYSEDEFLENSQKEEEYINYYINLNEKIFNSRILDTDTSIEGLKLELDKMKALLLNELDKNKYEIKKDLIENLENIYQDMLPEAKVKLPDSKVTIEEILSRASIIEDYRIVGFMIRNNVENNLINFYNIDHEGINFVMTENEFKNMKSTFKDDKGNKVLEKYTYKFVDKQKGIIEMPLIIRFIKAGLNYYDARKATKCWILCNYLIHPSKENNDYIIPKFESGNLKKELEDNLDFLKKNKLYL